MFHIEYEGAWTCQSALDWPLVRRDERYRPFAIERVPRKGLVWKNGVACHHCGNADQGKITKLEGKVAVRNCISATRHAIASSSP